MYEDLQIVFYPDPRLRKVSQKVEKIDDSVKALAARMFQLMREHKGVGLAAPQIGLPLRLAVINVTPEDRKNQFVIINPKIVKRSPSRIDSEEGCLSLPGVGGCRLKRNAKVTVEALNEKGLPVTISGDGLLARCLQHEIDHLDGKMIINRTNLKQRLKMRWAIHKLRKEGLW